MLSSHNKQKDRTKDLGLDYIVLIKSFEIPNLLSLGVLGRRAEVGYSLLERSNWALMISH